MRHFNYFENGGPYPGLCISCGATKQLFDIGGSRLDGGSNLLCKKCSIELATFLGYVDEAPLLKQMNILEADIEAHERELARIPDHVEDLINGIRSRVTDFVFAVSYSDSVSDSEIAEKPELSVEQPSQHAQRAKSDANPHSKPARK